MTKRLFLFASYDPANQRIDESALYYLRELAKLGDIMFWTDNNFPAGELQKIPNALFAAAGGHGEYDFGSYKRLYQQAARMNLLNKYDWVYFANDSVFGPMRPMRPILEKLEAKRPDITALWFEDRYELSPHVQSYFFGVSKKIACSKWLAGWLAAVRPLKRRAEVIIEYEIGLGKLFTARKCRIAAWGAGSYRNSPIASPAAWFRRGFPLLKKNKAWSGGAERFAPADLRRLIRDYNLRTFGTNKKFKNVGAIMLFGIPIASIEQKVFDTAKRDAYKINLFGFIPAIYIKKYK